MAEKQGGFETCKRCMFGRDQTFKCYPFCAELRKEVGGEIAVLEEMCRKLTKEGMSWREDFLNAKAEEDRLKAELTTVEGMYKAQTERAARFMMESDKAEANLKRLAGDHADSVIMLKREIESLEGKLKDAEAIRKHDVGNMESLYVIAKNDLKKSQREVKRLNSLIKLLRKRKCTHHPMEARSSDEVRAEIKRQDDETKKEGHWQG